jgi:hypothetical protein
VAAGELMRGKTFETLDTIGKRMQIRKGTAMTDQVTTLAPPKELPSPEVMSRVLLGGDLAQLSPAQLVSYYGAVCDSVGLNPLTKPFEFLKLSGKLVLYATRNCTDQLRKIYGISVAITAREVIEDTYVVTARATMPNGRYDESTGAVAIANLKGEFRANALLKCETKSKRRVTLSLVGLSTLDESEVDSIPGAQPVTLDLPESARSAGVLDSQPGRGAPAASADLNQVVPDAWKPFVQEPEKLRGRIVAIADETKTGKKSGKPFTRWLITLESGESLPTLDRDFADAAIMAKHDDARVEITTKTHPKWGKEITGIARLPDDRDGDVAF